MITLASTYLFPHPHVILGSPPSSAINRVLSISSREYQIEFSGSFVVSRSPFNISSNCLLCRIRVFPAAFERLSAASFFVTVSHGLTVTCNINWQDSKLGTEPVSRFICRKIWLFTVAGNEFLAFFTCVFSFGWRWWWF